MIFALFTRCSTSTNSFSISRKSGCVLDRFLLERVPVEQAHDVLQRFVRIELHLLVEAAEHELPPVRAHVAAQR